MSDISPIDNQISQIILKTKKITEALYRITDFFPDEEPLKWILRKEAVGVLNSFLNIERVSYYERLKESKHCSSAIGKILNLAELASFGSFVAKTNFDVLGREYKAILSYINGMNHDEISPILKTELLGTNQEVLSRSPYFYPGNNKNEPVDDAENAKNNNHFVNNSASNNDQDLRFNGRHDKILSLVKEKKDVSVGDIYHYFDDISEKTIQRDLISLVNRGILNMNGDKRWRRYALKS